MVCNPERDFIPNDRLRTCQSACVKVPCFCCHLQGEADGQTLRRWRSSGKSCHWQFLVFASLTANASRVVGIHFLALSKPWQPHQECRRPSMGPVSSVIASCDLKPSRRLSALLVELAGVEPASSTHPLQRLGRSPTTIITAGRRSPGESVFSGQLRGPVGC